MLVQPVLGVAVHQFLFIIVQEMISEKSGRMFLVLVAVYSYNWQ